MDKVGADIVAVKVHAGTAHVKRVEITPGPAGLLGLHGVLDSAEQTYGLIKINSRAE